MLLNKTTENLTIKKLKEDNKKLKDANFALKQATAIAVIQLYEYYKEDVIKTFSISELQRILEFTEPLKIKQMTVENIYKSALTISEQNQTSGFKIMNESTLSTLKSKTIKSTLIESTLEL